MLWLPSNTPHHRSATLTTPLPGSSPPWAFALQISPKNTSNPILCIEQMTLSVGGVYVCLSLI